MLDPRLVDGLGVKAPEDPERDFDAELLLALAVNLLALRVETLHHGVGLAELLDSGTELHAEMLVKSLANPLPIPILGRLVLDAAFLGDGAHDAIAEIEHALALLAEPRRHRLGELVVHRNGRALPASLDVELHAPKLIDLV